MGNLSQVSAGGKVLETMSKSNESFTDAYYAMATLGGSALRLTDLVPDQYPDDLENDQARLAMVSMLTDLLNNVYEKFNKVALEHGARSSVSGVIRASHLDPQEQLREILRQAMRNVDITRTIAREIGFDDRRARELGKRFFAQDDLSSSVEERAWVRIHSLSWIQSALEVRGYPYLRIGMGLARTVMSPSFNSLEEVESSDGHIDVPRYLEFLRKKVALMHRIGDLFDGLYTTRRFRKLICEHLHHAGNEGQLNRVAELLETGAPLGWIESVLGEVQ